MDLKKDYNGWTKASNSLEVGEDDQRDDQGDDGQGVTHHGQVVQTHGKLQGQRIEITVKQVQRCHTVCYQKHRRRFEARTKAKETSVENMSLLGKFRKENTSWMGTWKENIPTVGHGK